MGAGTTSPGAISGINENTTRQNSENPKASLENCLGKMKHSQQVHCELPKEIFNFCDDIINNILSHDQLLDFVIKCDIPTNWVERAKEDYPHDSEIMVTKVFFEWWGRCHLNVGKKIQMIQVAFVYMGKLAVFNRIIGKYPDLKILLEFARSNVTPALTGGDGVI